MIAQPFIVQDRAPGIAAGGRLEASVAAYLLKARTPEKGIGISVFLLRATVGFFFIHKTQKKT